MTQHPSWGDQVVPALRKRLQSESKTLARRLSAISLPSADELVPVLNPQKPQPQQQQLIPSQPKLPIPKRSRTSSSPKSPHPTRIPKATQISSTPFKHHSPSSHSQPNTPKPFPTLSSSSRSTFDMPRKGSGLGLGLMHESPPFPVVDSLSSSSSVQAVNGRYLHSQTEEHQHERDTEDPPRPSIDSEERPYEHWYRGEVSRNGGVGELKVGKRQEMLDIANYGHVIRSRKPANGAVVNGTGVPTTGRENGYLDLLKMRRRPRAGSIGGLTRKERDSLYLDEMDEDGPGFAAWRGAATAGVWAERVLDQDPPTDFDKDDDDDDEGEQPKQHREEQVLEEDDDFVLVNQTDTQPYPYAYAYIPTEDTTSSTPNANANITPPQSQPQKPPNAPHPRPPSRTQTSPPPTRIPHPSTSSRRSSDSRSTHNSTSTPATPIPGPGPRTTTPTPTPRPSRSKSDPPTSASSGVPPPPSSFTKRSASPGPGSSLPPPPAASSSSSSSSKTIPNANARKPTTAKTKKLKPRSQSKPPPSSTKTTKTKEDKGKDKDKRTSVAMYPTVEGGEELADAIPSWTQPVTGEGGWDDVVLPVVARKKGLEGYFENTNANASGMAMVMKKRKGQGLDEVAPAPGTFGYDHSKYRRRPLEEDEMGGDEFVELDEFGAMGGGVDEGVFEERGVVEETEGQVQVQGGVGGGEKVRDERVGLEAAQVRKYDRVNKKQDEEEDGAGCCKCVVM